MLNKIKVIIIDFSEEDSFLLKKILKNYFFYLDVVYISDRTDDLVKKIEFYNADLLFLDIDSKLNFEKIILKVIEIKVDVILITKFPSKAIFAFKYNLFSCIQKPYNINDFYFVINKLYNKKILELKR
jgi:two-component SAPR family response regulator